VPAAASALVKEMPASAMTTGMIVRMIAPRQVKKPSTALQHQARKGAWVAIGEVAASVAGAMTVGARQSGAAAHICRYGL
jgi:hypothetical protein